MTITYLTFAIAISFISWMVGIIINGFLVKTEFYKKISSLNFITNKTLNKIIGIDLFNWIIINTPLKLFNVKISGKDKKMELNEIRNEMTIAEIGHLIGFIFVTFFAIYKSNKENYWFGLVIMIVNVLMNLYPSLLQQRNKRRIDILIQRKNRTIANYSNNQLVK